MLTNPVEKGVGYDRVLNFAVDMVVCNSGVCFTKVFRTELGHKYILVECSVIALCLPVVSKITRYKLVLYK